MNTTSTHPHRARPARLTAGLIAAAAGAALLAGCGSGSDSGSSMSCGHYMDASSSDQKDAAREVLKDTGNSDPGTIAVMATQQGLKAYCATQDDDAKLSDASDAINSGVDSVNDFLNGN